ncbi:MAG: HK97 family phage prohead protease [Magnetococcales bacterium]|nr:HK97 family phage prohead protease [Magnetococcales bacterium]
MPQVANDTQKKQRIDGVLLRADDGATIVGMDEENRSFTLSFSSDEPYLRASWFDDPWMETLGHDVGEIDLSRLSDGAPLLFNHDRFTRENFIGVVEKAWTEGNKGFATVRLSQGSHVDTIWSDVKNKILRNVSVGYKILERTLTKANKEGPDEYRVTSWLPMEVSLVTVPADQSVGVGRSENYQITDLNREELNMPQAVTKDTKKQTPPLEEVTRSEGGSPVNEAQIAKRAAKEALAQEQVRQDAVRAMFKPYGELHRATMDSFLANQQMTPDMARKAFLDVLGKGITPTGDHQAATRAEMGQTDTDKFRMGAESAIMVRAGFVKLDHSDGNHFRGYTLLELARKSLELSGINTSHMSKMDVVGRAFTHSTSDFTNVLSNAARKSMLRGFEEVDEVYQQITTKGVLTDFKAATRVGIGTFGVLPQVREGAEYTYGTIGDRGESVILATFGRLFAMTRQMIINDDLHALAKLPGLMGRAAKRTIGDLVFAVVNDNPNMSDGKALFHADHGNLATANKTSPTVVNVGEGRVSMGKQKDGEATLNIRPSILLAPLALEGISKTLMKSETDPSKSNSKVPNPVAGTMEVVTDARLDAKSSKAWYMLADPNQNDGIEVSYLDGQEEPFMEEKDGWNVDGVEMKVRIDAGVKPTEHRTWHKNAGE